MRTEPAAPSPRSIGSSP